MRDVIKAMKALSDETRLRVLNLLLERECCVCEVVEVLGIAQSTASRSLGILYDAGLLKYRRDGLRSFYSIEGTSGFNSMLVGTAKKALAGNHLAEIDKERLRQLPAVARL